MKRKNVIKYNFNRKRDKKREAIIRRFLLLYPFEFVAIYENEDWYDFFTKGNFNLTYRDIKNIFKNMIKDRNYEIEKIEDDTIIMLSTINGERLCLKVAKRIF